MKTLLIVLVLGLGGCVSSESTYWRHPVTGDVVECDYTWQDGNAALGLGAPFRDYCSKLMRRAGLVQMSHEEGKAWEDRGTPR